MVEISTITAILGGIKTATDIAKGLISSDTSKTSKEDLKSALLDMTEALADAKLAVIELREEIQIRDEQINNLMLELNKKKSLVRLGDFYYEKDTDGNPTGDPYCQTCYESNNKLHHLVQSGPGYWCQICTNGFKRAK